MTRVLVVDDESSILDTLRILLRREGFEVTTARTGREALDTLAEIEPDVVITDIRMPGFSGLDLLTAIRSTDAELPVILMTAQASLKSAVQAVNHGAFYYLQKPFGNDELVALCHRAAETRELKRENRKLKHQIERREQIIDTQPVGRNRSFTELLELAEIVAPTDSTVLVTGESGTGKEVVARYIHSLSNRVDGPFVSVNCAALPETLLESELFGHVKGSFTGAVRDKEGLLVAANGGTFLLDEVAEMSPSLQVKLLRALQEREVVPVGATEPTPIDVRIIAATNRDLEHEMRTGGFRTDLYYRINVIALHLPPLRERADDIPLLTEHFLKRFAKHDDERELTIHEGALEKLKEYDWPGNVRELENALERAAILCENNTIKTSDLSEHITEPTPKRVVSEVPHLNPTLELIERAYILYVLEAEDGNKTRAAETLGIDPSTLYRRLSRYGIEEG